MSIITVDCKDQILNVTNAPTISAGGVETDSIKFTFCDNWNGFGKTAIFCRSDIPTKYKSAIINGEAIIPHEVLQKEGLFYFGVYGSMPATDDEGNEYKKVKTSQLIGYRVVKGAILDDSVESENPTLDDYDRINAALAEVKLLHPYLEDTKNKYNYTGE